MNKEEYIKREEGAMLHTYNRFPVVLEKGEGVYLYDTDGKKYLDFAAGIAVEALGYGNRKYNDALKDQIDKLMHTSNLYYNLPIMEAAEKILKVSKMDRVFFTNSGTEAITLSVFCPIRSAAAVILRAVKTIKRSTFRL